MRKTKEMIAKACRDFVDAMIRKFPDLEADISAEPWEGSDAWIEFGLPEDYTDEYREAVQDETVRLAWEFRGKTGVSIISSLTLKEALHG